MRKFCQIEGEKGGIASWTDLFWGLKNDMIQWLSYPSDVYHKFYICFRGIRTRWEHSRCTVKIGFDDCRMQCVGETLVQSKLRLKKRGSKRVLTAAKSALAVQELSKPFGAPKTSSISDNSAKVHGSPEEFWTNGKYGVKSSPISLSEEISGCQVWRTPFRFIASQEGSNRASKE